MMNKDTIKSIISLLLALYFGYPWDHEAHYGGKQKSEDLRKELITMASNLREGVPFIYVPLEIEFKSKETIHDFPFKLGKSFGGTGRKCPHMALINITPDGNCCHSCIYCYSRDHINSKIFEKAGKIILRNDLPEKLDRLLGKLALCPAFYLCPVTDAFQCREAAKLTLEISEVLMRHGVSFHYVTKSSLVMESLDLVKGYPYFFLQMTVETSDENKRKILSPRASSIEERINVLQEFSNKNIYTAMRIDPVIEGFVDWEELLILLKRAKEAGVKHIICSTGRFGLSSRKSVLDALEKAGFREEAEAFRKSYVFFKGFRFLPIEKRSRFHTKMKKKVESLGMTYSVCGELGKEYDSKGIPHCEGAPNSHFMRKIKGKFKPICYGDCLRSCPNLESPPCCQQRLQVEYPYKLSTLK